MPKRIYIAGGGGMLGEAFYQQFKNEFELKVTDKDVNESWISFLDFRDYDSYHADVLAFKPDYLFHLGAHTSLEYCELNIEDAYKTNTTAVENAVKISNELNIPLLYISTAGIFDGKKMTYDDWDIPNPLGHYARSKYMGERFVVENKADYLVCRAGWMMGGGPGKDKKFVSKILKQIKEGKKELNIVNDKFGTPTYTHDFARNVKVLLEKKFWGVYNLVCEGETSRMDVAKEIIRLLNKENEIRLKEVDSDFFKAEYFAERPFSERLVNVKLKLRELNVMRDWQVCLEEYLDTYYKNYFN
ncbi:MAG TPA: NAD(P)-dependent oxidoreductase [Chitinophagaceae bacterium]|nr:NAD(P)-dependent oxidoreductase [Chitinophagaceae bacterium]